MSLPNKRILVTESGLIDFFKSFFKAKANNTESVWLQKVRKYNPKVADAFKDYDDFVSKSMQRQIATLKSAGLDTKDTEDLVKKLGLKK